MDRASDSQPQLSEFLNPRLVNWFEPVPVLASAVVIFISGLTLCGWAFIFVGHANPFSFLEKMSPFTAACLILSASALLLLLSTEKRSWKNRMARLFGAAVTLTATFNLLADFSGGGGSLAFLQEPSGMKPITALNSLFVGIALLSYELKPLRSHPVSHLLAFPIAVIALLPLVGHLYGSQFTTGMGALSGMAPHSAICFLMLSVAIFLGRINHDLAAILISDGPGGSVARRVLPPALLIPLLLGWAKVTGERTGLFSAEFGTALVATASIAGFMAFIWHQGTALQRTESKRRSIQREHDFVSIQNQLRDQFVAMISHDLRTPLTAASSYAQLIRRYPEKHDLTKSYVDKLLESLSRSDQMIQNLLDVNRIRAGHPLPISVSECDLSLIIQATVNELAGVHGDRFKIQTQDELRGTWDPLAIRRAVENLCNNALKYGEPESVVTVRVQRSIDRVRISVHNSGSPIPLSEQANLFEPFQRSSTAEKKNKKGWGIGLTLVRAIAEAHGGSVVLKSTHEHGTEFTIDLPAPIDERFQDQLAS